MAKIELIVVLSFALVLSTQFGVGHGITEYIKTEVSSDGDANKETPASLEDVGLTTGELKKIGSEIKEAFQKIGGSVGQALSPEQEDQEIKEAADGAGAGAAPSGNFEDLVSSVVADADAPSSDDAGAAYGPSSDGAGAAADAAGADAPSSDDAGAAGAGSDAPSSDDAGAAAGAGADAPSSDDAGAAGGAAGDAPSSGDAGAAGGAPSSGDAGAAGGAPSADAGAAGGAPSSGDAGAAGGAASSDAGAADAASSGEGESAK